jgi:hypothetical protein
MASNNWVLSLTQMASPWTWQNGRYGFRSCDPPVLYSCYFLNAHTKVSFPLGMVIPVIWRKKLSIRSMFLGKEFWFFFSRFPTRILFLFFEYTSLFGFQWEIEGEKTVKSFQLLCFSPPTLENMFTSRDKRNW